MRLALDDAWPCDEKELAGADGEIADLESMAQQGYPPPPVLGQNLENKGLLEKNVCKILSAWDLQVKSWKLKT